jgi:hypothetical protein
MPYSDCKSSLKKMLPRQHKTDPLYHVKSFKGEPTEMKQTLDVINRMEADGIIGRYAIAARWRPTVTWTPR